jgi:hypothetical protein
MVMATTHTGLLEAEAHMARSTRVTWLIAGPAAIYQPASIVVNRFVFHIPVFISASEVSQNSTTSTVRREQRERDHQTEGNVVGSLRSFVNHADQHTGDQVNSQPYTKL